MRSRLVLTIALLLIAAVPAHAQQPRAGGELVYVVGSESPSYDAHREETFGLIHPAAPHYSTLLRVDPTDTTGTRIIGDLAESWTTSKDGLTYTFKIRRGVKFHDGSALTARDVKASYDKIINPPPGLTSPRKGQYAVIESRAFNPSARDAMVSSLGSKITVKESAWDCALWVVPHHEKKPWDDPRVRRALTLAVDRWNGSKALSKITIVKEVGGLQVPGTTYAATEAELGRLAGYGRDVEAARAEARRLLREAGVPDGFAFVFNNRNLPEPYEPLAIWLVDQWKKIGLNATVRVLESASWFHALRSGDFEVSMDGQCGYIVEPDLDLYKFLSADRTDASYGRYTDRALDALYDRQARARDVDERRKLVREFEKRLFDEQAHVIPTLWWHRIVPYHTRVRGWTITPSHFLNGQLDTIWLAE